VDEWDEDDEMGVAAAFVMAFSIAGLVVIVTTAAIVWNVASLAAEAVRRVRG
jgi:hypothetical protein